MEDAVRGTDDARPSDPCRARICLPARRLSRRAMARRTCATNGRTGAAAVACTDQPPQIRLPKVQVHTGCGMPKDWSAVMCAVQPCGAAPNHAEEPHAAGLNGLRAVHNQVGTVIGCIRAWAGACQRGRQKPLSTRHTRRAVVPAPLLRCVCAVAGHSE